MLGMKSYLAAIQAPAVEGTTFIPNVVNRYPVTGGRIPQEQDGQFTRLGKPHNCRCKQKQSGILFYLLT
jgi:hypothetical protein